MQDPDLQIFRNNRVDYRLLSGGCKRRDILLLRILLRKKETMLSLSSFFLCFYCIYEEMLAEPVVIIISQYM